MEDLLQIDLDFGEKFLTLFVQYSHLIVLVFEFHQMVPLMVWDQRIIMKLLPMF